MAFRWLADRLKAVDPDARAFAVGYLILLPIYLAPIVLTKYLPGLDLPFHLSVADMLLKADDPGSPYAPFYASRLGIAPYAAHYIWLLTLGRFISLVLAHNLIIGVYVAGLPLAMARLLGVLGRSRLPALIGFPLAFNLTLHYGFISFCLSMPVLALLFASLARHLSPPGTVADAKISWWRLAGSAGFGVLLFLCHLQNFLFGLCGALAILVFCRAPLARRLSGCAALVPALACLLLWWLGPQDPAAAAHPRYGFEFAWQAVKGARLADIGLLSLADDLRLRIGWFPEHVLKGFTDMADVRACNTIMVTIGAYTLVGAIGRLLDRNDLPRSRFQLASWVIFLGAVFAYFALPHHLRVFELMTFYPRFSVLVLLFALPLVPSGLRRLAGPMRYASLAPAVLVCALYGGVIHDHYTAYRAEISDFVQVLRKTPPGGSAAGLIYDRRSTVMRIESAFVGFPGFYVARRSSATSMVPLPYCGMRHMPCVAPPSASAVAYPGPWLDQPFTWASFVDQFDYFFVRSPPPVPLFGDRADRVRVIAQQGTWTVYAKLSPPPPPPVVSAGPDPASPSDGGAGADAAALDSAAPAGIY